MKKDNLMRLLVLLILVVSIAILVNLRQAKDDGEINLAGYQLHDINYVQRNVYTASLATGTSIPVFIEPAPATKATTAEPYVLIASSSIIRIANIEEIDMNLWLNASTTGTKLNWTYYFSEDKMDWYPEDGNTDTSDVIMTHGATKYVHSWTPAVAGVAKKHVNISDSLANVNADYLRIVFDVSTASGSLYAEIMTQQNVE